MAFIGVLNSCDTLEMKSVCRVSVALSSLTIMLKLLYRLRTSLMRLSVSAVTLKFPPATVRMAFSSFATGSKNTFSVKFVITKPKMTLNRTAHTKSGAATVMPSHFFISHAVSSAMSATTIYSTMHISVNQTRSVGMDVNFFFTASPPCSRLRAS